MRLAPWLLPRVCPASNCSTSATDRPRRASHQAAAEPMAPGPDDDGVVASGHGPLRGGVTLIQP